MTRIAGVDGCPVGWLFVELDLETGNIESAVAPTIASRIQSDDAYDVVTIDIPIGLTEKDARQCDVLARRQLGPRASSVFPAPVRAAIVCTSYPEAAAASIAKQQKSISKQSFAIYPKIREVDDLLRQRPELLDVVFEVHPEVCFQAWNDGRPMAHAKKSPEGGAARRALIAASFGSDAFASVRERHRRSDVSDDDIADAFAALWTARRIMAGEARSLPADPPRDAMGLPMAMLY